MRVSIFALLLSLLAGVASATPPRTLSYQGVLTDAGGSIVPDGSYTMTFALYLTPSGGAALWTETQNVSVASGNFDVILGSVAPITAPSFNDPYWLGLQVDADLEMTPRTELTGVAYSQMARMVEDGAINASKIANNTVVRSLNGMDDTVNIVGGNNVTVTPVGNDIEISASTGGGNAPGVAGARGITSGVLTSSFNNLVSRTIDCPADGYVLVIASTDVFLNHQAGNPTTVVMGTSDVTNALSSSQDLIVQIPFSAATGLYTIPFTSHGLYPVSEGLNTFYLIGRLSSISGSATVNSRYMTVVYFESAYGTVSATAVGDPLDSAGVPPGEIEMTKAPRAELTNEDLGRELATLRARLESLEAQIEGPR